MILDFLVTFTCNEKNIMKYFLYTSYLSLHFFLFFCSGLQIALIPQREVCHNYIQFRLHISQLTKIMLHINRKQLSIAKLKYVCLCMNVYICVCSYVYWDSWINTNIVRPFVINLRLWKVEKPFSFLNSCHKLNYLVCLLYAHDDFCYLFMSVVCQCVVAHLHCLLAISSGGNKVQIPYCFWSGNLFWET